MQKQLVHKIFIEPISPVYIGGSTDKILKNGFDYVQNGNMVYIIDHEKLLSKVKTNPQALNNYIEGLLQNNLQEFLTNFLTNQKIKYNDISIRSFSFYKNLGSEIKAFIRNGLGQPYIPGSSIKGAIRSALYHNLVKKYYKYGKEIKNYENEIFGDVDNNFMRFVQVSDVIFNKTCLINTKVFSLKGSSSFKAGWKQSKKAGYIYDEFRPFGFTTTYEILDFLNSTEKQNSVGVFTFNDLSYSFLKKFNKSLPPNIEKFSKDPLLELFKIINKYTKEHLKKEIEFFKEYTISKNGEYYHEQFEQIIKEYNEINNLIPEDDHSDISFCILRLGGGSGFHSITGDWQFENHKITNLGKGNRGMYEGKLSAKTRKLAFIEMNENYKFYPFGFIKITFISNTQKKDNTDEVNINKKISESVNKNNTKIPEYYKGPIKQESKNIPALVVKSGKPNIVKLLIENNEVELPLQGYASELKEGKYIYVRITGYKNNKITQVNYQSEIK